MKKLFPSIYIALFTCSILNAQSINQRLELREAYQAMDYQDYEAAKKILLQFFNENPKDNEVLMNIGICYFGLNQFEDALSFFKEVNEGSIDKKRANFHYYYGVTLQRHGLYQSALEQLNKFKQKTSNKDVKFNEPDEIINQCNFALKAMEKPVSVTLTPLPETINSKYNEYHPFITTYGQKMYFTSRRNPLNSTETLEDGQYHDNIYLAEWNNDTEEWNQAKIIDGPINSKDHDSNTSLSADGKTMYIYRNDETLNNKFFAQLGAGDIYTSKLNEAGRWSKPIPVQGINTKGFYEGGASVSADGKFLYFISDRSGIAYGKTQGFKDIWVSEIQDDGSWGKPKNLGPNVNSSGNEASVFIHPNGTTLFFASDGHSSMNFGGYDVFKSEMVNGEWTKAVNLGYPINTHLDEKEIILGLDGSVAWISAMSRTENRSDMDIYQADLAFYNVLSGESKPVAILKGKVLDTTTEFPLVSKIKLSYTDKEGKTVSEIIKTDEDGNYYRTILANVPYEIEIDVEGYKIFTQKITLSPPPIVKDNKSTKRRGKEEEKPKTIKTYSETKKLMLEREQKLEVISKDLFKKQTIRFVKEGDAYVVDKFSQGVLDLYVKQLLVEEKLKLKLVGHFDNTVEFEAADKATKELLDVIITYITANNIDKTRILAQSKGSDYPIATNQTAEGKALNRRVEIMVVID